jgi:nicotinate-nucleotide adenylyltransferase
MSTIAIFGGSFNPPHVAHQMVCLYILEACPVDELWVIPTYRHPFAKSLVDFEHRFAMCELAMALFGARVKVSRVEEELAQPSSRTLHTLNALRQRFPGDDFRLVVGADILAERDKWYRWDEIERLAPPIVVGRRGYPSQSGLELPDVSSTEVRSRLASGRDASDLVPAQVMAYISERGLYS